MDNSDVVLHGRRSSNTEIFGVGRRGIETVVHVEGRFIWQGSRHQSQLMPWLRHNLPCFPRQDEDAYQTAQSIDIAESDRRSLANSLPMAPQLLPLPSGLASQNLSI